VRVLPWRGRLAFARADHRRAAPSFQLPIRFIQGDASAALQHFLAHDRPSYAALFNAAGASLQALGADRPTIQPVYFTETEMGDYVAKYVKYLRLGASSKNWRVMRNVLPT
jgi:hypothetical protein